MIYSYIVALQIQRESIHLPLTQKKKVSKLIDYPPRLQIYAEQTASSSDLFAEVQVTGLNRECSFKRIPVLSKILR